MKTMPRLVVSDTSPIRALHHLGLVGLLKDLFEEVTVPPAVVAELADPRPRFNRILVSEFAFMVLLAPSHLDAVIKLQTRLDPGEAEAIILAEELRADRLIDETRGRAEAMIRGISITGFAGILLLAKAKEKVPLVLPLLDRVRDELSFYVSDKFRAAVARAAGE